MHHSTTANCLSHIIAVSCQRLLSLGEYTGGNNFIAAPLPSCFSRLRNLEALFMANCHLKGAIPNWIGMICSAIFLRFVLLTCCETRELVGVASAGPST